MAPERPTVIPMLSYEDGVAALELAMPSPDYESPRRHRQHCEPARRWSAVPVVVDGVQVLVDDVDAHYARAKAAGAIILSGLEEGPAGRRYRVEDLEGHRWMFTERRRPGRRRGTRLTPVVLVSLALIAGCAPVARPTDQASEIAPSGLDPVFSAEARCPGIASPFGSRTRYDGSLRPRWSFGGHHGGIDISLAEGTPLVALAAGTVVGKGEGGQLEGIYVWLRHSPDDTGLAYWVYSKYQHLESPSELPVGATVTAGQVIARSGKTGTVGGHYGASGYPHLHLTTRSSARGDEMVGGRGETRGGNLVDPLVIYRDAGPRPQPSGGRPPRETAVAIPYATPEGQVRPRGTRVVWPVPCPPGR